MPFYTDVSCIVLMFVCLALIVVFHLFACMIHGDNSCDGIDPEKKEAPYYFYWFSKRKSRDILLVTGKPPTCS